MPPNRRQRRPDQQGAADAEAFSTSVTYAAPRCGLLAIDCAITHWAPALGGHREPTGFRAPCPICGAERALEFDVPVKTIRWRSWCAEHDQEALRPALAGLLPGCVAKRAKDRPPVSHDDLVALALDTTMPPMTLRLAILQLAGLGTQEALDKLGVRREHRSRVIAGHSGAPKRVQRSRS
jgi:hypothetical protein